MTNTYLSLYPNCSLGGMTTVYRNRALAAPSSQHVLLFQNDYNGGDSYKSVPNLRFEVVGKGRFQAYATYAVTSLQPDEVRITSIPALPEKIRASFNGPIVYEFHSSDPIVLTKEISGLDCQIVDSIAVPSKYLAKVVSSLLRASDRHLVEIRPNLVDHSVFHSDVVPMDLELPKSARPLIWVGRFDKGKNYRDFVRVLSQTDERDHGIVIVSMEKQPERLADFLSEAEQYGIASRMHVLMNLTPEDVASVYTFAAKRNGIFCSTSLGESYGYGVAEAAACALPVVAYDVGAMPERAQESALVQTVAVGDIEGFLEALNSPSPLTDAATDR